MNLHRGVVATAAVLLTPLLQPGLAHAASVTLASSLSSPSTSASQVAQNMWLAQAFVTDNQAYILDSIIARVGNASAMSGIDGVAQLRSNDSDNNTPASGASGILGTFNLTATLSMSTREDVPVETYEFNSLGS